MKNMMILKKTAVLAAAIAGMAMASCEQQPGKYEMSDGVPEVRYVRPVNVDASDSLMTGAYMDNQICIVGENLRSIYELWFNDRKAILNTSFITDNTLIVTVPGELPGKVTNMMYMVTASRDTVKYEFNVLVPAPVLNSMSCEYTPAGESATIYGDYLLDDENQPLEIVFSGDVPVTEITEITKTAVTFVIPEGAEEGGISVTTVNGTSSSAFHYLDSRGFLFDFDEGGTGLSNNGWHNRVILSDETSLTGNFVQLGDGSTPLPADGGWVDKYYSFEYWPGVYDEPLTYPEGQNGMKLDDLVDFSDYENMTLKFELFIPSTNPWSAGAMQVIFAGTDKVTNSKEDIKDEDGNTVAGANNAYFNNNVLPRGIYRPWTETGSFHTDDRWITVSLPISEFVYGKDGAVATGSLTETDFSSLVIFVSGGGINGVECTPIFKIDNIRVVPNR